MKDDFSRLKGLSWGHFMYHQKSSPENEGASAPSSSSTLLFPSGNSGSSNRSRSNILKKVAMQIILVASVVTFAIAVGNGNGPKHYLGDIDVDAHVHNNLRVSSTGTPHKLPSTLAFTTDSSTSTITSSLYQHDQSRTLESDKGNSTNNGNGNGNGNENNNCEPPKSWVDNVPKAALYTIIAFLVVCSAFFSGLTLALMGLDTTGLEIVMSGDDEKLAKAAERIYPVRKNGNLLLCTLLLGNVAVNTLLGILMADLTSGTVGFLSSTGLIVVFGEIIPQATFSRYALQVGEMAVPVMKVIILIFYVLAKPLAFCLDKLLGRELGTIYSKSEMSKLLEIHAQSGQLNKDEEKAMRGALQYQDMKVEDVMTPLEKTFVVNVEDKLTFATMATIFKTGYSRIPVFENVPSNIIGMLFVKDLIFINPEDETPIKIFVEIFGRDAHVVWGDDKLGEVLTSLKKGHCHMALVRHVNNNGSGDPFYEVKGIITLEDIIEVILGDQIIDETDAWMDVDHTKRVTSRDGFDWARLRLLDSKIVDQTLSEEEVRAVAAHLSSNYGTIFGTLSEKQLMRMIAATPVLEMQEDVKEVNETLPSNLLYEKEKPTDKCTLILGGKVTVIAGDENFRSDLSSWSLLASRALSGDLYLPDFSAYVSSGPCRCLQFSREIFGAAAAASELEAIPQNSDNNDIGHQLLASGSSPDGPLVVNSNQKEDSLVSVERRGKLLQKLLSERTPNDLSIIDEPNESSDKGNEKKTEEQGHNV